MTMLKNSLAMRAVETVISLMFGVRHCSNRLPNQFLTALRFGFAAGLFLSYHGLLKWLTA